MTNYAYLRVSTDKQDIENQRNAILKFAHKQKLHDIQFISETVSSRKRDRKIYSLIDKLESGDILIVFELSRLARSMSELSRITLAAEDKKATIRVIKPDLTIDPIGNDIAAKALVFALSLASEIEKNMISDRTKSALAAKKAAGIKLGRPSKSQLDSRVDEMQKWFDKGLNQTAVAKVMDVYPGTMQHWLKKSRKLVTIK